MTKNQHILQVGESLKLGSNRFLLHVSMKLTPESQTPSSASAALFFFSLPPSLLPGFPHLNSVSFLLSPATEEEEEEEEEEDRLILSSASQEDGEGFLQIRPPSAALFMGGTHTARAEPPFAVPTNSPASMAPPPPLRCYGKGLEMGADR